MQNTLELFVAIASLTDYGGGEALSTIKINKYAFPS